VISALLTLLVVGLLGGTFALGRHSGKLAERKGRPALQADLSKVQDRLINQEAKREHLEGQVTVLREEVAKVRGQRDEYARMAATHEVKHLSSPEPKIVRRQVFNDRVYQGHPEGNLKALEEDLAPYASQDVEINIQSVALGGWAHLMKKSGWTLEGRPSVKITKGILHYQGPPARVVQELREWFWDDDNGFVVVETKKRKKATEGEEVFEDTDSVPKKRWADSDSQLEWKVDLIVTEIQEPSTPEIQMVEVLKIQEQIVERTVIKPVPVTTGAESFLTGGEVVELVNQTLLFREQEHPPTALEMERKQQVVDRVIRDAPPKIPQVIDPEKR